MAELKIAPLRPEAGRNAPARNEASALDLDWVARRARQSLGRRAPRGDAARPPHGEEGWQAAWLLKAITCIDLTTLAGDDTPGRVERLCAKAMRPLRADSSRRSALATAASPPARSASITASSRPRSRRSKAPAFRSPRSRPAFPAGLVAASTRSCRRSRPRSPRAPSEIDIVITREHVLTGNWQALYDEMRDFRAGLRRRACEGDPRHRRPEDAAQRRQGLDGLHDGRRRFHQDLDRQGRRQRHAARDAGHGAHDPRLSRADRLQGRLQAGRRHLRRPRTRSTT